MINTLTQFNENNSQADKMNFFKAAKEIIQDEQQKPENNSVDIENIAASAVLNLIIQRKYLHIRSALNTNADTLKDELLELLKTEEE